jgi:hypothetical protein
MTISASVMSNRRRLRRHQLTSQIQVIGQLQGDEMGQLINIHQEGLLLMGAPLQLNSTHLVKLLLPNSLNQSKEIDLGIECLWSQQADEETYWSGCSIIDKSEIAEASIQSLINIKS